MIKKYCPYCGRPLSAGCDCEEQAKEDARESVLYRDEEEQCEWDSMDDGTDDLISLYRSER